MLLADLRNVYKFLPGAEPSVGRAGAPGLSAGAQCGVDFSDSLIVFGGLSATSVYNEVHVLSLSTGYWSRPECTGQPPPKRYGHSAVMVAANLMLLFGGCSAQVCSLFWTLLGWLCHSSCTAKVSGCPGIDGHCSFWPRGLIRILAAKDLPSSAYFSSRHQGNMVTSYFCLERVRFCRVHSTMMCTFSTHPPSGGTASVASAHNPRPVTGMRVQQQLGEW